MGDYTAFVIQDVVDADHAEALQIAARDCPVGAISLMERDDASGHPARDEDEKGQDVEERGEIAEYKRKHGDTTQSDDVEPDHPKGLEGGKHNFSIVRNGTHDN